MPNYAADDTDFIAKRLREIEKEKAERINDGAPEAEGSAQGSSGEEPSYMGVPLTVGTGLSGQLIPAFGDVRKNADYSFDVWDGAQWISEEQAQDRGIKPIWSTAAKEMLTRGIHSWSKAINK